MIAGAVAAALASMAGESSTPVTRASGQRSLIEARDIARAGAQVVDLARLLQGDAVQQVDRRAQPVVDELQVLRGIPGHVSASAAGGGGGGGGGPAGGCGMRAGAVPGAVAGGSAQRNTSA